MNDIDETLKQLSSMAITSAINPKIAAWAATHDNDPAKMLAAVQNIPYVSDPFQVEFLTSPPFLFVDNNLTIGCDADDRCTLLAAALVASGHKCRIVAHGYGSKSFTNCIVEVLVGDEWVPAETGRDVPLGQLAKEPVDVRRGAELERKK